MNIKDALIQKLTDQMKEANTAHLSSIDDNGFPRVVEMSNIGVESIDTIYFATGTDSRKIKHYKSCPRAGVSYNNGVSLIGNVSIMDSEELKQNLWQDWMIKHFIQGVTDPDYCIICFKAEEARVYVDDVFTSINLR